MSWFQSTNIASFAKSKLKEVQQSIDKALDIKDEAGSGGSSTSATVASVTEAATDFFASWGVGVKGAIQEESESPEADEEDETESSAATKTFVITSPPSTAKHSEETRVSSQNNVDSDDTSKLDEGSTTPIMRRSLTSDIPVELVGHANETTESKTLDATKDDGKFQSLWLADSDSFESSIEAGAGSGAGMLVPNKFRDVPESNVENLEESTGNDFTIRQPIPLLVQSNSTPQFSQNQTKPTRSKKKRNRSSGGLQHTKHKESSGIAFSSEPSSSTSLIDLSEISLNTEEAGLPVPGNIKVLEVQLRASDSVQSFGDVSENVDEQSQSLDTSESTSTTRLAETEDSTDNTEVDLESSSSATMVESESTKELTISITPIPEMEIPSLPDSGCKRSSSETSPEPPETDGERHSSKVSVSSRAPSSISVISEEKESSPQCSPGSPLNLLDSCTGLKSDSASSASYEVISLHNAVSSARRHLPFDQPNSSTNFEFMSSHHCPSHSSSISVIPSLHSTPERGTPQTHSRSNSNTSSSFERIEEPRSNSNHHKFSSGQNFISSTSSSDIEVIPLDSVDILPPFLRQRLSLHEMETQTEEDWPTPQKIVETKEKIVEMIPSKVAATMAEKDSEIQQLREEGEKLSKKQFELTSAIKKLRQKEKETDGTVKSLKTELANKNLEIERLMKSFINKESLEQSQNETIGKLNQERRKYEDLVNELRSELEDAKENCSSMKASLEDASVEILELQNTISSAQRDTAELDALTRTKGELTSLTESLQKEVEHLRLSINSTQSKASNREAELKGQISSLTQKIHRLEGQVSDVSSEIADATMPLSLEIDKLQQELKNRSQSADRRETTLHVKISELEHKLKSLQEHEKSVKLNEEAFETTIQNLESHLESVLEDNATLKSKLEKTVEENLKNSEKLSALSQLEAEVKKLNENVKSLKQSTETLNNDLKTERNSTEAERKKNQVLIEQLKLSQAHNAESSNSFSKHDSRDNSPSSHSMISEASFLDDVLDPNGMGGHATPKSFFDSFSSMNFIESLQGQLRQRELEVVTYQDEVTKTEKIRKRLNDEIAHLTVKNQELLLKLEHLSTLQQRLVEVEKNYNAVLQMYGEKVEEADELRMDLQDVKEMYKIQIEQLLKKS